MASNYVPYQASLASSTPNIAAPPVGGMVYATYVSSVTEQILRSEPESVYVAYQASSAPAAAAKSQYAAGYVSYAAKQVDAIASAYMVMDGEAGRADVRAAALVQQAQQVQLRTVQGEDAQWENLDSKHRMGDLLIAAWNIYRMKGGKASPGQTNFFRWLDGIPEWERIVMLSNEIRSLGTTVLGTIQQRQAMAAENKRAAAQAGMRSQISAEQNLKPSVVKAFVRGIKFLDAASRPSYVVSLSAGPATYRGRSFDTTNFQTVFSGKGFGIWVMDKDGALYAGNHVFGQMHHTSFLAGGAILAGGEISARNGNIEFISGKSGHYTPPIENLIASLKKIRERGVNIAAVRVMVWGKNADKRARLVTGADVVNDGGKSFVGWGPTIVQQTAAISSAARNGWNPQSLAALRAAGVVV